MTLSHLARFFRNPAVPSWRKWAGLVALAYVIMPLDFLPDVLPVVGWLDDLGVVAAFLANVFSGAAKQPAEPKQPPSAEVVDVLPAARS